MTMTLTQSAVTVPTPDVGTLPDGDALGNDILASAGAKNTARLIRQTAKGGTVRKARRDDSPPRIMFSPRAWTMGGNVD